MSVNFATLGMFKDCCPEFKGGAPPYRREDEPRPLPYALVSKVEVLDVKAFEKHRIDVRLIDT